MNSSSLREKIIVPAVVGALYAALTMLLAPISYGPIQFRLSEALCVLPLFFPYTSIGLFLGCLAANLMSPVGMLDIVFGSLATLGSELCILALGAAARRSGALPDLRTRLLSCLMPVVWNGVIIGAILSWTLTRDAFWQGFVTMGAQVALGEAVVLYLLGLPLIALLPRLLAYVRGGMPE